MPSKTITEYNCGICKSFDENTSGSGPCQLSHIKNHCKSTHHKKNCEIFKLNLQMKTNDDILIDYPEYLDDVKQFENKLDLIDTIIFDRSMIKNVSKKVEEENTVECQKYEKTNILVSELTEDEKIKQKEEEEFKCVFIKFLDKCHNTLRSNQSVIGTDALDDIIYTFLIVYLSGKVTCGEDVYNFGNTDKSYYKPHERKKIKEYLPYLNIDYLLNHVDELRSEKLDAIKKIGYILSKHPSTKNIIKNDNFINSKNANSYAKLLKEISDFSNKYNIFKHTDIIGRAYEYFVNGRGSGDDDTQHFTERPLMNMSFKLIDEEDIIDLGIDDNSTIGDEFCGTFGYPINLKKYLKDTYDININDKKIYGVEQHDRLSRYAKINAMLSLTNSKNVTRGDSFVTNVTSHLDIGIYNVPFGKKSNYIEKEELYKQSDELPDFKSVCKCKGPLAVTSSQLAFYKVKKMGLCIIKDGVETSSPSMKAYRKHLCDNYVIKKIMKIPQGMFASTSTATACIYFIKKEGKSTENIQFLQLNKECSQLHEICKINLNDLKQNNYSWDPNAYLVDEKMKELTERSKCEFKMLKDVCDIQNGKQLDKKNITPGDYKVYGGGMKIVGYHNNFNREGHEIIIAGTGVYSGFVSYSDIKFWASQCFTMKSNNDILNNKFLYYLCKYLYEKMFMEKQKGGAQPYIRISDFKEFMIPIPKIEIQTKCVEQLNDLSNQKEMITSIKDGIKRQMKYFIDSQIQKGLKEYVKLDTLYNTINGKYNSCDMDNNGEVPFYACKAINPIGKHSTHSHDKPEYILLVTSGGSQGNPYGEGVGMGKCYYINGKSACRSGVLALIPKEGNLYSNFHYYYLQNHRKLICDKAKFTTNLGTIGKTEIDKLDIPIVDNYEEITQKMNELSDKIKNLDNDIVFIDNLMKDIMQSTYQ